MNGDYAELIERLKVLGHYGAALALLSWDQETYMPDGGAAARAELCSAMSGLMHEYGTSREMAALYRKLLREELRAGQKVVVNESYRRFSRKRKLPTRHVAEEARVTSLSHQAWTLARKKSDFSIALPHLEKIIQLKRRECEYIGYKGHPYDALLDDYEPHAVTSDVDRIFDELREPLMALASRIRKPVPSVIRPRTDEAAGAGDFCRVILEDMGFDFDRGRLDESVHPFATTIHPSDVRMTVRKEHSPVDMIFSALHEGGHSLYNQGLDIRQWGTPLADTVSLGIHESQSRLWENQIGRSLPFWKYYFPELKKRIPRTLAGVGLEAFLKEINRVSFSFIRVDADEVTYGLHVILRFELEKALIEGSLLPRDVPAAWNDKMERYLGIRPKNDAEGCLQDVHWYTGGVGYFPTYVLGNLYAAQFYRAYQTAVPAWKSDLEAGRLKTLRMWLKEKIHRHGSRYTAAELVKKVTGEKLHAKYFVEYLEEKYRRL